MTAVKAEITAGERTLVVPGIAPGERVQVTHKTLGGNDLLMLERHAELMPDHDGAVTHELKADGQTYAVSVVAASALVRVRLSRVGATD